MANSGQKWSDIPKEQAEEIKKYLLKEGGLEQNVKGPSEVWRVRFSDATITYYSKGTLFSTGSKDPAVHQAWEFVSAFFGPRFEPADKQFLIGLDETGKGELFGHTVLVGSLIPADLAPDIGKIVSVADTKQKRSVAYWDNLFRQLDGFKVRGLQFIMEKIPPWHVDKYNLNKIMDVVYQRILNIFFRHVDPTKCRVVLDDYGVGEILTRYLRAREKAGTQVVVTTGADDRFLEARVASVLAKREREKVMEAIRIKPDFQIGGHNVGSGNPGDPQTVAWLKAWKKSGQQWPWFVKRSFSTIRKLDGLSEKAHKVAPPIREDILSHEFLEEFEQGRLSITSLSVVCPSCGDISKATLLTPDKGGGFEGRCLGCKTPIPDLAVTLRYYCGYVIPDSNIITGGLLSRDLERSRFFEDFTILLDAVVRQECEAPGGKKELGRLAEFAAKGRINLEEVGSILDKERSNIQRDELILGSAIQYNAILITNDKNMKAAAQAKNIFTLST